MRNYLDRRRIRRVSASALGFGSNAANNLLPDISAEFDKGIYTSNRARLDFSELLTFARSSTATYVDSTGTLQTAAANEARTNHHVWNGASFQRAGMLVEEGSAQILTDPIATVADWDADNVTVTDLTDNFMGAFPGVLVASQGSVFNRLKAPRPSVTSGTTYSTAVFIKEGTSGRCRITFRNSDGGTESRVLGAFGSMAVSLENAGAITLVDEQSVPGGTILYMTFVPNFTNASLNIGVGPDSSTVGEDITAYFMQFEASSVSSSPILTGSTARAADDLRIPAAVMQAAILAATGSSAMPDAISIAVKGRMTYADENLNPQSEFFRYVLDGNNQIQGKLTTNTDGGRLQVLQIEAGTFDSVTSAVDTYTPGNNVPFSIASRHGATFINGAHEGTLLTADLTPTALPDLTTADFQISTVGNFIIEQVLIWFVDIGDAGITEASAL